MEVPISKLREKEEKEAEKKAKEEERMRAERERARQKELEKKGLGETAAPSQSRPQKPVHATISCFSYFTH